MFSNKNQIKNRTTYCMHKIAIATVIGFCTVLIACSSGTSSSTPASSITYAYVGDFSPNLWQCQINISGQFTSGCTALQNSPIPFKTTISATFATFGGVNYAYVNDSTSNLWQCPVNALGQFTTGCTALTNSPNFNTTRTVTFNTFNNTTYAYISDLSSNLWRCPINNSTGRFLGSCTALTNSTTPFITTIATTFATFNGTTYVYVSDSGTNLWQCPMDANGGFSSGCIALANATVPGFTSNRTASFNTFGGITYAYVGDFSANIWQCPMNATGGFSSGCTALSSNTVPGFNQTRSATFANFGGTTYTYVGDASKTIWQCPINTSTGQFSGSCTPLTNSTAPGFTSALIATFYQLQF